MLTEQSTLPICGSPYSHPGANGVLRMVGRHGNGFVDTCIGEDDPNGEVCGWCMYSYEPGTHDERRCLGTFAASNLMDVGETLDMEELPMGKYTYRQLLGMLSKNLQEAARVNGYPPFRVAEMESYLVEVLDNKTPASPDDVVLEYVPFLRGVFDKLGIDGFCDWLIRERGTLRDSLVQSHARLHTMLDTAEPEDTDEIANWRRRSNREHTSALEQIDSGRYFAMRLQQMTDQQSLTEGEALAVIRRLKLGGIA